jgi:hypothetical protein
MDRKIEAVNYVIIYSFFGKLQIGTNVNLFVFLVLQPIVVVFSQPGSRL